MKSSKFQAPNLKEAPTTKLQSLLRPAPVGGWSLVFIWSLELGIWSFVYL